MNSSKKLNLPYYPQRARWYSGVFYLGTAIHHRLALDRLHLPKGISLVGVAGSFLVPGLAAYLRGSRLWGNVALAAYALSFFCFFLWLGYPFGNYAFGLLLSIHATGFVYYCSPCLTNERLRVRLVFTVLTLIGLGCCLYAPLRSAMQNHALTPLRMNDHVVVVGKFSSADSVKRGEWIAYNLSGYFFSNHGGQGLSSQNGISLGSVLATAGDRIEFSPNSFTINGIPHAPLPHMPASGNWVVPENHWFIWPKMTISGNWNVGEASISSAMLQLADVAETQFVGKPFKRWFWRKQILP